MSSQAWSGSLRFGATPAPRLLEERRHRPQVRADRPELPRAVEAIVAAAAQDAVDIDLIARLLLSPGEAAVGNGLVEGLEAGEGVGPIRRGRAQVIEQPRVRGAERLGPLIAELPGEVLADQRVGVDGERSPSSSATCSLIRWARSRRRSRIFHSSRSIAWTASVSPGMTGSARKASRQSAVATRSNRPVRRSTASVAGLPSAWARDSHASYASSTFHAVRCRSSRVSRSAFFRSRMRSMRRMSPLVGVEEEPAQQREAERVAAELLAGVLQLLGRCR